MKRLLLSLAYRLTCKHVGEEALDVLRIALKAEDLSYFNLSSNPIISFRYEGALYYFRECPVLRSRTAYFTNAIESFFKSLSRLGISKEHFKQKLPIRIDFTGTEIDGFKTYIDAKKQDKGFIKSMSAADIRSQKCGFSIWENKEYDNTLFESFDLYGLGEELWDIALYFLWYMRSAASSYKKLGIAKGKRYSYFNAVRAISSRIVAEELGLGRMISDVRFCTLELDDGEKLFGVLSSSAEGSRMSDAVVSPSGSLQRELLNLNALDVICRQTDHGPNNYNVCVKDGAYLVCAFDNDNQQTFFPLSAINGSFSGCSTLVDKKGVIIRPYFDKQTAENIRSINIKKLKKRLKPYLNSLQTVALVSRIKKLNKAILKTQSQKSGFLLETQEFSEDTARRELEGDYGLTYLSKAVNNELKEQ